MKRFSLYLCSLMLLLMSCNHGEEDLEKKATTIIENECDCFNSAGITFSEKIKKVFEEGVGSGLGSYLRQYDSLDNESMKELKKFVATVYDSSFGLGNCLNKARRAEVDGLSDNELVKLTAKRQEAAMKDTGCRTMLYYETGAIASAKYTIENKKPDISFQKYLPDSIPLRVVIIRHGEKPDSGLNLTCRGYNRSLALPDVIVPLFGIPKFVYVPIIRIGKTTNSVRMYQTVIPLVVRYDIDVNSKHAETDSIYLAEDILKRQGTVLVVWNSTALPSIARNLGIKNRDVKWDRLDYDTIWVIDFIRKGNGKLEPRLIVTKENLDPSDECQ